MLTSLKFNLSNTPIRYETLQGRRYLVAPMAMITEGVHNGSGGPLLYRETELRKAVPAWNMKPIVVYHPAINGQGVSACDPDILEKQQVGMVMHSRWDKGKLRAEAWIEEDRAAVVDNRVLDALTSNKMMEVSTGLFTDSQGGGGEWAGKIYNAEAVNHQPDHLALLPDQVGACSIADGAGLLQMNEAAAASGVDITGLLVREMDTLRRMVGNALSYSDIHSTLSSQLRQKMETEEIWLVDVYDGFFVYEDMGKYFRHDYTRKKDAIELVGDPQEVTRVTEYKPVAVGNNEARKPTHNKEHTNMDKKLIVSALIANALGIFNEAERETLMALPDATLEKLNEQFNKEPGTPEPVVEPTANAVSKNITAAEYVAAAPPEIRDMLTNGLATHNMQKAELIKKITSNSANLFSAEFLGTKGIMELQGLAALATPAPAPISNATPGNVPMFAGQSTPAGPAVPVTNAGVNEGLPLPTMTWD